MNCSICRKESAEKYCPECRSMEMMQVIEMYCNVSESKEPLGMAQEIMGHPAFPVAGQPHHPLIAAVLVAAFRNAGGTVSAEAIPEAIKRGNSIPGGYCAGFGADAAAIACGIAVSVIRKNTITAEHAEGRALAHALTGEGMLAIANNGGNRCCKRSVYGMLELASNYFNRSLGVRLSTPAERVRCAFHQSNKLCNGTACRYYP